MVLMTGLVQGTIPSMTHQNISNINIYIVTSLQRRSKES